MICITSLRNEYDTYIRNWFLTQFEGSYCYKDSDGIINWVKPGSNWLHFIYVIEYNTFFKTFNNLTPLTPKTIELLQYIIKKPYAKHGCIQ